MQQYWSEGELVEFWTLTDVERELTDQRTPRGRLGLAVLLKLANRFVAVEIKAGETVSRQFFTSLSKLRKRLPEQIAGEVLVYGGDSQHVRHHVRVTFPQAFVKVLEEMESELIEEYG